MIKYQKSSHKSLVAMIVLAAALLTVGGWWWIAHDVPHTPSEIQREKTARSLWPEAGVGEDTSVSAVPIPDLADTIPSGVDADDWLVLKSVLARMGQPQEHARQLVDFSRYQRNFEKMQTLDQETDALARRRLAQDLRAELPQRLKAGDFTLMESAFMGAALIAEIETDEEKRSSQLAQWQTEMLTIIPEASDEVALAHLSRETEWRRRMAGAFMEWQLQADPTLRTETKLEQAMEAARREFNSGAR